MDDFYVDIHDRAEDPSALWHVEAGELRDKLAARGKWPAKPDIRSWWGAAQMAHHLGNVAASVHLARAMGARWNGAAAAFVEAPTGG